MDATQEQWRPVVGYEGIYEVSNLGQVRSLDRYRQAGRLRRLHRGKVLSPGVSLTGHLLVVLYGEQGKKPKPSRVHRLVLEAFVSSRPDGMECCHSNGDPTDNRLTNLRWDTRSANNLDRVLHGTHHNSKKTHCPRGHEFTPENTKPINRGRGRACRICRREQARASYHGKKAKL